MTEVDRVREHILQHGWNSTCFQIVNPGILHWWSEDGQVLVGYVVSGKLAVVAGAPVCPSDRLGAGIREWELFLQQEGLEPCYFGAEQRLRTVFADSGEYTEVVLGCQPEWSPSEFVEALHHTPSLRAQLHRSRNKGVRVSEWHAHDPNVAPPLAAALQDWLDHRGLPSLGFLVEPHTLANLTGRRVFIAYQNASVVGFVTLCPIPARNGWLTEQFVRTSGAPNGTVETLLEFAVGAVQKDGAEYLTMGIVPLLILGEVDAQREPSWLVWARKWARAHYTRFYNFRGLLEFKAKFRPTRWAPVVVAVRGSGFRFGHLRGIVRAFTGMPPEAAFGIGILRGIRLEIESTWRHLTKR